RDSADLAHATGVDTYTTRLLADAMTTLGLLERSTCNYTLTTHTAEHTRGSGQTDRQPLPSLHGDSRYRTRLPLAGSAATGKRGELDMSGDRSATFMSGVMRYHALHARMLAAAFDFAGYHDMLDLGGLSPDFAIGALRANPELSVRFVYAPEFTEGVTTALAEAGFADRARIEPAATDTARPGGSHDIVMANHVLHRFTAEQNRKILANARAAAATGATLLLLDFYLHEDAQQRPLDALPAGEYLVI